MRDSVAGLQSALERFDNNGEYENVVDGLFAIAESLSGISRAIDRLGLGSAATSMGAIEAFIVEFKEFMGRLVFEISAIKE